MKEKRIISMSDVGLDSRVNLENIFCIFQDSITRLFEELDLSNRAMRAKHHCIWVFTKQKADVYVRPYYNEEVLINCRIVKVTSLLTYIKTEVMSKKKELYISGVTECCAIDYETFKFKKTSEIKIPFKAEEANLEFSFEDADVSYVTTFKVSLPLVDGSNHLNNARAVLPLAMNLSKEETFNIYSKPFQLAIKYQKQAMLGDDVRLFINHSSDRISFVYKKCDDVILETGHIKTI